MLIETFVVKTAVEAFDLGVLIELAWLDQAYLNTSLVDKRFKGLRLRVTGTVTE